VTRKCPNPVVIDYIHIPKDIMKYHRNVTLALDIMHIGGLLFLITTSRDRQFTMAEKIESSLLAKDIMKVVNLYKKRRFVIDICLMDNEFESVRGILQEQQIQSNICAPNEHVPISTAACHSGHTLRYMVKQNMEMMQWYLEQLGAYR
jgi:hypothetical protein